MNERYFVYFRFLQVGSSYSCWYDTRNPSVAQWDKPSTTVAIILLGCGGLSVLFTAILLFLGIRFIKREKLRKQNDNMNSYPHSSSYIKQ
jgi:hypothetical protein